MVETKEQNHADSDLYHLATIVKDYCKDKEINIPLVFRKDLRKFD